MKKILILIFVVLDCCWGYTQSDEDEIEPDFYDVQTNEIVIDYGLINTKDVGTPYYFQRGPDVIGWFILGRTQKSRLQGHTPCNS